MIFSTCRLLKSPPGSFHGRASRSKPMAGTRLHDQSMNVSIFRPAAWRQATSAPAEEPADEGPKIEEID